METFFRSRREGGQLSPRNRKRIKSLAARKVPKEEWRIRQNKDNLVMVLQKKQAPADH